MASPSPAKSAAARADRVWAAALGGLALALYVATLAPSVVSVFDDSLEFQVVLPTLGIAHPTGYPLYTILGWLWSHLPIGDLAYRSNLLSAVLAAATVGLVFLLARRLGSARLAAAAGAALFALSPLWWSQATVAEVYAGHGLAVASLLWLALRGDGVRKPWLALAFGLALTHHRTTLLLAPALAVALVGSDPAVLRRPARLVGLLLAAALPLLIYLYLPWRGQSVLSLDGANVATWDGFWRHVLASDYRTFFQSTPAAVAHPAHSGLRLLLGQIGPAALAASMVGLIALLRRPAAAALLALAATANWLFATGYRTADAEVFTLPVVLIVSVLAAVGVSALFTAARARLVSLAMGRMAAAALAVLLGVSLLWQPIDAALHTLRTGAPIHTCAETLAVGGQPAFTPKRNDHWNAFNCGLALLNQPLAAPATVIGLQGETTLLRYEQLARSLHPQLRLVDADQPEERLAAVEAELAAGRAVYLTRELAGLPQRYSLSAAGPLIRVWPAGAAPAQPLTPTLDVALHPSLRLTGFTMTQLPAEHATWMRVAVATRVTAAIGEEWKVSARLLGRNGAVIAAVDSTPVHWAYPTTAWRVGETVLDAYDFALPAGADVAALRPLLIWYRAADGAEIARYQP